MAANDSEALEPDEVLENITGFVETSQLRLDDSLHRFTDEAPVLARKALAELDRLVLPANRRGHAVIEAAVSLVDSLQGLDLLKMKIDGGFLKAMAALIRDAQHATGAAENSIAELRTGLEELSRAFGDLNRAMGLTDAMPNTPMIEVLLESGFLNQQVPEESGADPILRVQVALQRFQGLAGGMLSDLRERIIVLGSGIIVVYNRVADVLDDRLDVLSTYLSAVSETRGDDQIEGGHDTIGIVEEVVKEGLLEVAQEYLAHVVPAAATGGFPLVGALFSAAAATEGVNERRRHRQKRREWAAKLRLAVEQHSTSDDMWDFRDDYLVADTDLERLLDELESLEAALSL